LIVATKDHLAAIGQGHDEFTEQSKAVAIELLAIVVKPKPAFVPAIAEAHTDGVITSLQQVGHVVSLILDPVVIGIAKGPNTRH